jgi:hypothetical protein
VVDEFVKNNYCILINGVKAWGAGGRSVRRDKRIGLGDKIIDRRVVRC